MSTEAPPATASGSVGGPEIMAAVDDDGEVARFVIADVTADDAWVAAPLDAAAALPEWR